MLIPSSTRLKQDRPRPPRSRRFCRRMANCTVTQAPRRPERPASARTTTSSNESRFGRKNWIKLTLANSSVQDLGVDLQNAQEERAESVAREDEEKAKRREPEQARRIRELHPGVAKVRRRRRRARKAKDRADAKGMWAQDGAEDRTSRRRASGGGGAERGAKGGKGGVASARGRLSKPTMGSPSARAQARGCPATNVKRR